MPRPQACDLTPFCFLLNVPLSLVARGTAAAVWPCGLLNEALRVWEPGRTVPWGQPLRTPCPGVRRRFPRSPGQRWRFVPAPWARYPRALRAERSVGGHRAQSASP